MGRAVVNRLYRRGVIAMAQLVMACASPARAQESTRSTLRPDEPQTRNNYQPTPLTDERQTVGTVSSVRRGSVTVMTDEERFMVFSVNRAAVGIPPVDPGARVRVTTAANDNDPAPMALAIEQLPPRQGLAVPSNDRVPDEIQQLTSQIERQARRFRAGAIAGAVLDPEMISVDALRTGGDAHAKTIA